MVTFNFTVAQDAANKLITVVENNTYTEAVLTKLLEFKDVQTKEIITIDITTKTGNNYTIDYNLPDGQYDISMIVIEDTVAMSSFTSTPFTQFFYGNAEDCVNKMLLMLDPCDSCNQDKNNTIIKVNAYYQGLVLAVSEEASNKYYSFLHVINRICNLNKCNCNVC